MSLQFDKYQAWRQYPLAAGISNKSLFCRAYCWYLAYALSYRDIEEMMRERGINMDHSTIHRWVIHYAPQLEKEFRMKKRKPSGRWWLDETYIKVKRQWKYYYRAVDKKGEAIDFLLTAKLDKRAALRFLRKAIGSCGKPSLINIDKSGSNTAAIRQYNKEEFKRIELRQCKYLNNIVEQDHRLIKHIIKPMLGLKCSFFAQRTFARIEPIRMLRKGQMRYQVGMSKTPAELFYTLAG